MNIRPALLLIAASLSACSGAGLRPEPRSVLTVRESTGVAGIDLTAVVHGSSLPGATIRVSGGGPVVHERITDVNGTAHFDLSPGAWKIEVNLEGLRPAAAELFLAEETRAEIVADLAAETVESITIACPPPWWEPHAPGQHTFYHLGHAWPQPAP